MAEGDPKLGQKDSWRGDPITLCTPEDELPTLYHTDTSYYSQVNKHCPPKLTDRVITNQAFNVS